MYIGIDIETISRFEHCDDKVLHRVFTDSEREYCMSHRKFAQHLAGMWCAKEAVIKALEDRSIDYIDIVISHKENGAPYVVLTADLQSRLANINASEIHLSISHDSTHATAVCLLR